MFLKLLGKPNNYQFCLPNIFVTISHINYCDQANHSKTFWTFWNGPLCRNKSASSLLLNVAAY